MMPTIRIDDDVWKFLQSKAKPFEDTPNDVLRRELGLDEEVVIQPSVVSTSHTNRNSATPLLSPDKDYSYQEVSEFVLDEKSYPARSYKDVLIGVSTVLRREDLSGFDKVALGLRGKKRAYFSLDPKDLRHPLRVRDSNLFVETNLNANLIVGICLSLVKALGHDITKFEVR
jgi:negative regulator of replication initiation